MNPTPRTEHISVVVSPEVIELFRREISDHPNLDAELKVRAFIVCAAAELYVRGPLTTPN